jgi:hypothetical protein
LEAAAGALGEAGAAAGLPAAGAEVVAGEEAATGAVSSLSEDLLFFEPLFLLVEAVSPLAAAGAADLLAVVLSAASAVLLFLVLLFLVLLASALAVESAPFELSAATALLLFLEVLFFVVAAESLAAALALLAAADFFDLDLEVLLESALASDASSAAAFFLVFFFVVVLLSVWSEEPDCCTRAARLPHSSSMDASRAKTIVLLDFISLPPVLAQGCYLQALKLVQVAADCLAGQTHDLWS